MQYALDGKTAWIYTGGRPFDASLPAMVFIHGAEHDHSVWALQSRYFAHHGRAVLAVDLPGHGRSAGPALESIEQLADWIATLLQTVGVSKATLVGHSMGSLIAMECAARHPQLLDKLVLVGTAFPMKVSDELLSATRDDEAAAQTMVNLWSHSALAHYPGSPGPGFWVQGVNRRLMQRQKAGVMHVDFRACNEYTNGLTACASIRFPVLLVLGKRDIMTPPRAAKELMKAIADKRVVEIEGAGHAIMTEKPDELLDALRGF